MCVRHPVSRAASITVSIAVVSAASGRRGQEVGVVRPCLSSRCRPMICRILRVHDEHAVEGGDLGHRLAELGGGQRRELRHAGVEQETFETEDAGVVQLPQVAEAVRHSAAPEADVDRALAGRGTSRFTVSASTVVVAGIEFSGMSRMVVTPPAAAAAGGAGEALPLRAAGLVDVHVGVDQPGEQHLVVGQFDQLAAPAGTRVGRTGSDRRRSSRRGPPTRGGHDAEPRSTPTRSGARVTSIGSAVTSATPSRCVGRPVAAARRRRPCCGRGRARGR